MGRDSQICACQLARSKSAEGAALCPSDMMLCVISYWVLSGAKRRQIQQLRCCAFPAKLLKRRNVYLKLTRHNGRAGAHGTYNPKHNDRSFNLANSEHIDPERAKGNIYWDCFHGFRSALDPQDPDDLAATFSDVERQFYESRYSNFVESQNERNAKIRHTERNRSIPDLLSSRKTCPEETIYQLGTLDEHASAEDLLNLVTEFIEEFKAKYAFLEDYTGDRVCSKQLYAEALGNTNIPAEWETRAICEIMNTGISRGDIQGWQAHKTAKRYPKYGVQKGWERVTSPETGAEDFSEITDAEAQQLGFPF